MLRLSKLSDYATVLMTAVAGAPERVHTGVELASRTRIPAPTVAKLLKALARGGLLESLRGAHGGYRLARSPEQISVADVISALEGPISVTDCATHAGGCSIERNCAARANWRLINSAIHQALAAVTLAQMASQPARRAEHPLHFHATTAR